MAAARWQTASQTELNFKPAFENPSAQINMLYTKENHQVGLYVGFYRRQNYSSKLVSSNNVVVTTQDVNWSRVNSQTRVASINGQPVQVRVAQLRATDRTPELQGAQLLVWQIYWINGSITASDYIAKVYSAFYRLTGQGDDSAVIMVYAAKLQLADADAALAQFLTENYAAIDALLRKTRLAK